MGQSRTCLHEIKYVLHRPNQDEPSEKFICIQVLKILHVKVLLLYFIENHYDVDWIFNETRYTSLNWSKHLQISLH